MPNRFPAAVLLLAFHVVPLSVRAQEESSFDVRLFRHINNQQTEQDGLFEFIDESSFPLFITIPVGLLLYGTLGDERSVLDTGILTGVSQFATFWTSDIIKLSFDRPRPFEELQNVKLKHQSSAVGSSFPSGHTSQAFAIATMLAYRSRSWVFIPALAWAALVGYGRIYVGVHYPTDVLGGLVLGVAVSMLVDHYREDIIQPRLRGTDPANVKIGNTPIVKMSIPFQLY